MKYEIRELSIGGILDQAIKVLKDNFGILLGIACVLQLPVMVLNVIWMAEYQFDPNNPEAFQPPDATYFVKLGVILLLLLIALPITNAAMVYAISDSYLGKKPGFRECFSRALGRIGPLILTWFLVGLAVMGGLILCIVPGILCMIWFALATQVVVLEPRSGVEAMKRSKDLMKGNVGKWFVLMVLIFAINFGIQMAFGMVALLSGQIMVAQLLNVGAQILVGLVSASIMVVFYFSARCAHENFDLELLAASFGEVQQAQSASAEENVDDDNPFQER